MSLKQRLQEDLKKALHTRDEQQHETIVELRDADRLELFIQEEADFAILEEYLPKFFSREEIAEEARQIIADIGATGMRQIGTSDGSTDVKTQGSGQWARCERDCTRVAV